MARTPSCDKNGLRKGTWTSEEDRKLIAYVTRYGCWNWRQLPKFAGLARCGKSCRLRWMNYLRPNLKRGNFTPEEEEIIIRMHKKLGNRWSVIAAELQGRTDNEVKNHWHTTLKKRVQVTNGEEAKASKLNDTTNIESSSTPGSRDSVPNINGSDVFQVTPAATSQISDMTGPLSPLSSSTCEFSSITSSDHINASSNQKFVIELDAFTEPEMNESFWTEPYLPDFTHTPGCASQNQDCQMIYDACVVVSPHQSNLVLDNDFGIFLDAYKEPTVDNFLTQSYVADMSHVPSELLTPNLVGGSEYSSTVVYDTDLWS